MAKRHIPRGLEILHDDRDLYVVNKRSGILTTGTGRANEFHAEAALTHYFRKGNLKSRKQVHLVHRLDRETSGVLLFAKSVAAQQWLKDDWKSTEKFYLAVVHGELKEPVGVLSSYLAESETYRVYAVNDPEAGRHSVTSYEVIATAQRFSLVKIRLITGRKHQIRVHFADLGHPVYGDKRYGPKKTTGRRLYLHARSIAFNHPHDKRRLTFMTPMPRMFADLFTGVDETLWEKATPPIC